MYLWLTSKNRIVKSASTSANNHSINASNFGLDAPSFCVARYHFPGSDTNLYRQIWTCWRRCDWNPEGKSRAVTDIAIVGYDWNHLILAFDSLDAVEDLRPDFSVQSAYCHEFAPAVDANEAADARIRDVHYFDWVGLCDAAAKYRAVWCEHNKRVNWIG